jgi:hypothetical protein
MMATNISMHECFSNVFAFSSPCAYNEAVSLKLYLVTCDLLAPGEYNSLRQRLRTLCAVQILDKQWALRSTHSAMQLKAILKEFVDDGDRIVIAEIGAEWASRRALADLGKL